MTYEQEKAINKILRKKRRRIYLDFGAHEFAEISLEFNLDRLAELVYAELFDILIKDYLGGFEDLPEYHKLTIMSRSLASTLKGYIGIIRNGSFHKQDIKMLYKTEDDMEYIISEFKNDIVEIYIPKRGYKEIFHPYLQE